MNSCCFSIALSGLFPGAKQTIVNPEIYKQLPVKVLNPYEIGADLVANAVAALQKYGKLTTIIDFGTAITFDLISKNKEYLGGVIAPGMELTSKSLHLHTALLPEVPLVKPKRVRGTNTKTCIQSGIYYSSIISRGKFVNSSYPWGVTSISSSI